MSDSPVFPTAADFAADHDAAHARARALFEMVEPADDWRGPIEAWIDAVDFPAVAEAVMFFTSTKLCAVEVNSSDPDAGKYPPRGVVAYRVRALGYRAGPAGP